MADITWQRTGQLVHKAFEILLPHEDGLPAKEVLVRVEAAVQLTPFENSDYANRPGVRRFEKIVRFGTIQSVKAGWLLKSKGRWSVTDAGKKAFEQFQDPVEFARETRRLYRQWAKTRDDEGPGDDEGPSFRASTTIEEAEEGAWRDIEDYLLSMNPFDFQELVAGLLRGMGYHVSWVSPPGPDKGVDIIAHKDPLGTELPRIKVQVKRRQDKVSVDEARSFMAVLGDQDIGIFVNAGGFTKDAEEEVRMQEKRRIMLVDLQRLYDLWVKHYNDINEQDRRRLPLRPVHYLDVSE